MDRLPRAGEATLGDRPAARRRRAGRSALADVKELDAGVKAPDWSIDSTRIAGGAQGLLDEVAASKISGEEDIFSHTDLWDFNANAGFPDRGRIGAPDPRRAQPDLGKRSTSGSPTSRRCWRSTATVTVSWLYDKVTEPQRARNCLARSTR